jgi:hypothetical protein
MKNMDPLERFERLAPRLAEDAPPPVHVVHQVMRRIRLTRTKTERTLEFLTAGSCAAALIVVLFGFSILTQLGDPLDAIFDIVPPIGL